MAPVDGDSISAELREALDGVVAGLRAHGAKSVSSVVLYGSAARGEHDPSRSNLNLLVALADGAPRALARIGPTLREAWRAHRVRPYLATKQEIPRLADVFPVRVLDMQTSHVVLHGPDPLDGIEVTREHLRLRVEQELRNHLLRMRYRIVQTGDDLASTAMLLARTGSSLRSELFGLLHAAGHAVPSPKRADVFNQAAKAFRLSPDTLAELGRMAVGVRPRKVKDLARDTIVLLERAVEVADLLET